MDPYNDEDSAEYRKWLAEAPVDPLAGCSAMLLWAVVGLCLMGLVVWGLYAAFGE